MTKINWDSTGSRHYEAGVDRGVYYPLTGPGEVWNGLTSVQESPSDMDVKARYIDGIKTRNNLRLGDFAGTIEAFSYPNGLFEDILTQSRVKNFGMSYRVKSGDSYKIHLVYNVLLSPSEHDYNQETTPLSWTFTTLPKTVPEARPTAHLIIDASETYSWTLAAIEDVLYGSEERDASLPSPTELFEMFESSSFLTVIDHGDGSWTATGPNEAITVNPDGTFLINWPSAMFIDATSYTIRSL